MQAQLDVLQERMDELPSPFTTPPPEQLPPPFADRDEVKAVLKTINDLAEGGSFRSVRDATWLTHRRNADSARHHAK